MNCPACAHPMTEITTGAIAVDACQGGCGGLWFDPRELRKVDERHEGGGEALLDIPRSLKSRVDLDARRRCPRCPDTVLMRRLSSPQSRVTVDECPACGGFFLDPGELARIREESADAEPPGEPPPRVLPPEFAEQVAALEAQSQREVHESSLLTGLFQYLGWRIR